MRRLSIGTAMVLALAGPAVAQSLRVSSATVDQPGHSADICVSLDSAGHEIAGTQNDLVWDGACATLEREGSCRIAPDVDKQLAGRIQGGSGFRYRAVVLSFEDVDPINDGPLYCCAFRVTAASGTCCTVAIEGAGLSDPLGNAIHVAVGPPAQVCVAAGDGTPYVTLTPTPTPSPVPPRTCATPADCAGHPQGDGLASASSDGAGCQTVSPRGASGWWLITAALLWFIRRRQIARAVSRGRTVV